MKNTIISGNLKVAIVEDSTFSLNLLTKLITQLNEPVEITFIATNAYEAIENLREKEVDLLFLDVEMPELNGFEILEKIGEYTFKVVFTTAHENYALKAFKINAFDYLMKPIDPLELKKVVDRYLARYQKQLNATNPKTEGNNEVNEKITEANGNILIDTHGKTYFLNIAKIVYLKAERVYTNFCYEGKNIIVSKSTNFFEPILIKQNFCRIHRSYLINLNQVKEIIKRENSSYFAKMDNNDELSISRQNKEGFLNQMKKFIKT